MKSLSETILFLILLTFARSLIIDRQLSGKDDRAQEFYTGIVERTKQLLEEGNIQQQSDEPSEHETNFVIDERGDARINIKRESNEILITMKNKYGDSGQPCRAPAS